MNEDINIDAGCIYVNPPIVNEIIAQEVAQRDNIAPTDPAWLAKVADKFALSPDVEARDKQYNRFCKKFREEIAPCFKRIAIGGVGHGKPRNGEAEAVANAVGREAVPQGGSGRIMANKPSARTAPTTPRRKPRHLREGGRGTETGQ